MSHCRFRVRVRNLAGVSADSASASFATADRSFCAGRVAKRASFDGGDFVVDFCLDDTHIFVQMASRSFGWLGMMVGGRNMLGHADTWIGYIDAGTGVVHVEDRISDDEVVSPFHCFCPLALAALKGCSLMYRLRSWTRCKIWRTPRASVTTRTPSSPSNGEPLCCLCSKAL